MASERLKLIKKTIDLAVFSNEERPGAWRRLIAFLESLPDDEICFLATVMYGGRDYRIDPQKMNFQSLFNYFKPTPRDGLITSIMGKTNLLPEYLEYGIKAFDIT